MRELTRDRARFALVMVDLDRFKQLNDTYGHEAGDRALRLFSQVLRESVPGAAALGASDAILWELAACEETLREQVAACDALESKLHLIESQLTQEERTLAIELDALIRELTATLESIDTLDAALRSDADDLEAMVGAKSADR